MTNPLPPRPYVPLLPREAACERCGDTYMKTSARQRYCGQPCREFVADCCGGCGEKFDARVRDYVRGWDRILRQAVHSQ